MSARVLFVDDDDNILATYKRIFRKQFEVHTALSGSEGLKKIEEESLYAVVISDLRMPGMDGFAFISKVQEVSPESICIMLSGHADLQVSLKAFNEGHIFRFLTKPCKNDILHSAISDGIEQHKRNPKISGVTEQSTGTYLSKKILIADDDPELLSSFANKLKIYSEVDVLTAENYDITIKILSLIKIDYIIIDLDSLNINAVKLLNYIKSNGMDIQLMAISWCITEEIESKLAETGCRQFVEKPVNIQSITETIIGNLFSGPKGIIDGISISAFLQMIEMEEKTCTLKIISADKSGYMYFLKGNLIDAKTSDWIGKEAAFMIINWVKAAIEIENSCSKQTRVIQQSLMQILMEAAKIKDDMAKAAI